MLKKLNMNAAKPFAVNLEMFREQRMRLAAAMRETAHMPDTHAAFLQGGSEVPINSSEWNYLFVQEPFFYYLFGTEMPDCYGIVGPNGHSMLFIPRPVPESVVWLGALPTPKLVQEHTGVDECFYVEEMEDVLKAKNVKVLEVMRGVITDSGRPVLTAALPFKHAHGAFTLADAFLFDTLSRQRCYKTSLEMELLKYVGKVSSNAHIAVMQSCRPGKSQHQLESTFLHEIYHNGGCRRASYSCICPTGKHNATMHYIVNDQPIEDGQVALLDMGGNYEGYAADITCSFPVNGHFTEKQKIIYNAVLEAHDNVIKAMKPGVPWVEMHDLAMRTICEHLVKGGFLHGDVDELMGMEIMQFFMPAGLGHLIGLDVHDVGGYLPDCPPRPTRKDACKLRTARTLEEGLHITVEPGCYFNETLMEQALADPKFAKHLDKERIKEYANFGGVRIESDVVVTKDGVVNFTCVPRTTEEVERTMAGQAFDQECRVHVNA